MNGRMVDGDSRAALAVAFVMILSMPLWAGCLAADEPSTQRAADWSVGDRWTYLRHAGAAPPTVYEREVVGLFAEGANEVFEVREGILGAPTHQTLRYTVGRLLYAGGEVREGNDVRQSVRAEAPIPFHYIFPLEPGKTTWSARFQQQVGNVHQVDTVEVTATVSPYGERIIGERLYQGWPYEIRIEYTTTPIEDVAIVRGFWSPGVGQSVETLIIEGEHMVRYELLSFERAVPLTGAPVYGLVEGLEAFELDAGFDSVLGATGYVRYLFYVEEPSEVSVRFSFPPRQPDTEAARLDLATLRPLGYTRAGVATDLDQVATDGVLLHVAASQPGGRAVDIHTTRGDAPSRVFLAPGQVYELLLASNQGGLSAQVRSGGEVQSRAPAEVGQADVVAVKHRRVTETTGPGPQNVHDSVTAIVSLPDDARVEGLVYAVNHGAGDAIGEVDSLRRVLFRVDASPFEDPNAVYGFYQAYPATHPFEVEAGFEYRSTSAVQGAVDYEVGALLMRLAS